MREWRQDWRDMFATFRIALDIRKMLLAFAGVVWVLTLLVIWVWLWGTREGGIHYGWDGGAHAYQVPQGEVLSVILQRGAFSEESHLIAKAFVRENLLDATPGALAALAAFVLAAWFVWSFLAAAISRIAAVEIARDERIELREALAFAWEKWASTWSAPVAPAAAFGVFGLCLVVWAWVGGLIDGWTAWIAGLTSPLAIFTALIMAFIFFGLLVGRQLMAPAIAAEGTDAFDGVSRAYAYVYSKPWHLLSYRYLWGKGYMIVTTAFVWLFSLVFLVCLFLPAKWVFGPRIHLVFHFLKLDRLFERLDRCFQHGLETCGTFNVPIFNQRASLAGDVHVNFFSAPALDPANTADVEFWNRMFSGLEGADLPAVGQWPAHLALFDGAMGFDLSIFTILTGGLLVILLGMALTFPLAYRTTQETLIYFLLRRKVDGVRMDEVYLEEDEEQFEGLENLGFEDAADTPAGDAPAGDTGGGPPAPTGGDTGSGGE